MTSQPHLCLVEDDPIMGESLSDRFALEGFGCDWYREAGVALEALQRKRFDAVVSDVRLPDMSGEDLFARLLSSSRSVPPFVFITAYGSIARAVELLKRGAADYIVKPFDIEELVEKLRRLATPAAAAIGGGEELAALGVSPAMRRIEALLPRLAQHGETLMLTGESGVGKERVAQALHRLAAGGRQAPFVAVNCGALSETLLEVELFGCEKGAFTGAFKTRRGYFELAGGGTLFLDEIGEMSQGMQVKVLRAIQEKQIVRVGGERTIPVSFRLVCATNADLKRLVETGQFREDLYYRINVIHVRIPPLRERREDILWLARRFLNDFAASPTGEAKRLSLEAEAALCAHDWPGNVRELKHCIKRACILAPGPLIQPQDLFEESSAADVEQPASASLETYLKECERRYIEQALRRNRWQIGRTAAALGISRKTLWEKMGRHSIRPPDDMEALVR